MAIRRGKAREAAALRNVDVVFFDVGGTLVTSSLGRLDLLHEALVRIGYAVSRGDLVKANHRARQAVTRSRRRRPDRLDPARASRMWLDHLAEALALDLRGEALEHALTVATHDIRVEADERVDPDAPALLLGLRQRGFRLGVISNWTADLPAYLEARDLARHFAGVVASEAVGSAKPHREIFLRALAMLHCPPRRAVHVGDDYWADVVGARGLGIRPVLLDRRGDARTRRDACLVIKRLKDLDALL